MAANTLDFERRKCHVCRHMLQRDITREREWCTNPRCQVRGVHFHIPYIQEPEEPEEVTSFEEQCISPHIGPVDVGGHSPADGGHAAVAFGFELSGEQAQA